MPASAWPRGDALAASSTPLLRVTDVRVQFGGLTALAGVSFDVEAGSICGLIGPNGAGKSTLFNCLSRLYDCQGTILLEGREITRLPRHRMAGLGIGRTFQNLALFRGLSVRENVRVGCHARHRSSFLATALRLPGPARVEAAVAQRADELLDLLELGEVADRPAGDLPFGTQKRVEMARALATDPKLLLLDEPACGLNHEEVSGLAGLIREIRDRLRVTVLLVEHHMGLVMSVSERLVALDFGRKIAEGTPAQIRAHPEVLRAYLGGAHG
jgi:branched-chain amino acid transport system ATP-binding protein